MANREVAALISFVECCTPMEWKRENLTWNLQVDGNAPICASFWAVYIQVIEADLAHAFDHFSGLFVPRKADLLAA